MKFNGTIFSKPQQDQLKEVIGKAITENKSIEFSFANTLSLTSPAFNAVKDALTKGKSAILSIKAATTPFFKVPLAISNTILSGYYVQVSPTENKTEEYFFRWAQGSSMKVTKRTTIYSAPIETSYETINVATSAATIIVGA